MILNVLFTLPLCNLNAYIPEGTLLKSNWNWLYPRCRLDCCTYTITPWALVKVKLIGSALREGMLTIATLFAGLGQMETFCTEEQGEPTRVLYVFPPFRCSAIT